MPGPLGSLLLIVPTFLLAVVFHPSLNNFWLTDIAWTFALYLEAVAILPQLRMFRTNTDRNKEAVEAYTGTFVFVLATSRLLNFFFWCSSYHELNDKNSEHFQEKYPGLMVVISQVRARDGTCSF